jgi:beta-glucanase (GH16 family)
MHFIKRIGDRFVSLLLPLALALIVSGCDTGQNLGKYDTELQAADDAYTLNEDSSLEGNVSTNDSVGSRTYTLGAAPANGTVTLASDGVFTYTPNPDFFGTDSFTVNVTVQDTPDTLAEYGWEMVWSDEFDGAELDAANWTAQLGDGSDVGLTRWGNNEQQWYQAENFTVADGNLVITARAEEVEPEFPYTSGRMRSIDKVDIKYGRIEARIKPPAGQGLWSAFWMLPTDSPYMTWPEFGEVDIMEVINAGTEAEDVFVTLHYGFPWYLAQQQGTPVDLGAVASDDFHTYAVEWEQDEFRWYVDGAHVLTVGSDAFYNYYYAGQDEGYAMGPQGAPFDTEFHILLNLAVGGNLPGAVAPETVFPAEMLVDYVRVYECSKDPATGAGCASFVDDSIEPADPTAPAVTTIDLYTDAAGTLTWQFGDATVARNLVLTSLDDNGGALLWSEVAAADEARGMVVDVNTLGGGSITFYGESVVSVDGVPLDTDKPTNLFGMGNNPNFWELHAAELKFDLYIDSAGTNAESALRVKMDSGQPFGGVVELAVADLPQDEWTTVSVKVNDLLANCGEGCLDTSDVLGLFVLEPTGMAHVQLDDIQLVCGHPSACGIEAPVSGGAEPPPVNIPVPLPGQLYTDRVGLGWALWDCCGGTTFEEVDSGDEEHGRVAKFTYNDTPTVNGFEALPNKDLSAFAGGTLEFDVYLAKAPTDFTPDPGNWFLKMEGPTGDIAVEKSLTDSLEGVEPTVGEWQHYTFNLDDLAAVPLDAVHLVMIFPAWGTGDGAEVWFDNVEFKPAPGTVYLNSPQEPWSLWDCCGGTTFVEVDSEDPEHSFVAQFTYNDTPTVNGFEALPNVDYSFAAGGTLEFDVYLGKAPTETAPDSGPWFLKMEGPTGDIAVEKPLTDSVEGVNPTVGAWQHYTFNLDDLAAVPLDAVHLVMIFPPWGTGDGAIVWYDNVRFVPPAAP